ncbi:hypothetical protein [Gorillibacterium massiliense]|uniref:hypothetical protein n=1 Tax=Gorillibacterium massiliense TaxID=1280390 RepID=UPI0004BC5CDE|nr:hypothetical protein [Gorillibacterium massiliense]
MTAHEEFSREKKGIDGFIASGYIIREISEDLDGAMVCFHKTNSQEHPAELRLLTSEGRKYITTLLIEQQKG